MVNASLPHFTLFARKASINLFLQLSTRPSLPQILPEAPPFQSSVVSTKANIFHYCTQQKFTILLYFTEICKWETTLFLLLAEEAHQFNLPLTNPICSELQSKYSRYFILHWQQFHMMTGLQFLLNQFPPNLHLSSLIGPDRGSSYSMPPWSCCTTLNWIAKWFMDKLKVPICFLLICKILPSKG